MLEKPLINVSFAPLPNIGKSLSGTKFLALEKNISKILKITIGIINKLAFTMGLSPILFPITVAIAKNNMIKIRGEFE